MGSRFNRAPRLQSKVAGLRISLGADVSSSALSFTVRQAHHERTSLRMRNGRHRNSRTAAASQNELASLVTYLETYLEALFPLPPSHPRHICTIVACSALMVCLSRRVSGGGRLRAAIAAAPPAAGLDTRHNGRSIKISGP